MWQELTRYLPPSDYRFIADETRLKASYDESIKANIDSKMDCILDIWEGHGLEQFLLQHAVRANIARKHFEETYRTLFDKSCAFILCDPQCRIIELYSSAEIIHECRLKGVRQGASLAEGSCGTNAVALAIRYRKDIVLKGQRHFCKLFHDWCCVAVPLFNRRNELIGCIDCSMSHEASLGEKLPLLRLLAEKLSQISDSKDGGTLKKISGRQKVIVQLLAQGHSSKEAAAILGINPRTMETHLRRMRKKVGAKTTCELVTKIVAKLES